jgi:hypothetical protein
MTKLFGLALFALAAMFATTAPTTICTGTIPAGTVIYGKLEVPENTACSLWSDGNSIVTVKGDVIVKGSLGANGSHFLGDIVVSGQLGFYNAGNYTIPVIVEGDVTLLNYQYALFASVPTAMHVIKGNLTALHGAVVPGIPPPWWVFVGQNFSVGKTLAIIGNQNEIHLIGVTVGKDAVIVGNNGPMTIYNNRIGKTLSCLFNGQTPVGSGNIAQLKIGQCSSL